MLLTPVLIDPLLRDTRFVLVHGGEPWIREVRVLFEKPNVYADFSAQTFFSFPRELAQTLRGWPEFYPERVLFGTDASPSPELGWEEQAWITTRTSRRALALALTGMMDDQEITREQAMRFARMVLHDNAAALCAAARPGENGWNEVKSADSGRPRHDAMEFGNVPLKSASTI